MTALDKWIAHVVRTIDEQFNGNGFGILKARLNDGRVPSNER